MSMQFHTTRWTDVFEARRSGQSCQEALARIYEAYWQPLFAYLVRWGCNPEDARDLTQSFFCEMIAKDWVAKADRERGKFRTYLLLRLRSFASSEQAKALTQQRGGEVIRVPYHDPEIEAAVARQASTEPSPEQAFDRTWARIVLAHALTRLAKFESEQGRERQFQLLRPYLPERAQDGSYLEIARELNVTPNYVAVQVARLRDRYRKAIRAEIADTVSEDGLIEEELRAIQEILSGP